MFITLVNVWGRNIKLDESCIHYYVIIMSESITLLCVTILNINNLLHYTFFFWGIQYLAATYIPAICFMFIIIWDVIYSLFFLSLFLPDCTGCYKDKYKLLDHLRSHTQEKRFACDQCGALFSNRTKYIDHIHRQTALECEYNWTSRSSWKILETCSTTCRNLKKSLYLRFFTINFVDQQTTWSELYVDVIHALIVEHKTRLPDVVVFSEVTIRPPPCTTFGISKDSK